MSDETDYRARRLVSVTEGTMYGPGDVIDGPFDPKDEHNAALIEAGSITHFRGRVARSGPAEDASPPEEGTEAEKPAGSAEASEDGGAASSATVEDVKTPKARSRRPAKKEKTE
jgi:hypothetical protein